MKKYWGGGAFYFYFIFIFWYAVDLKINMTNNINMKV